MSLFIGSLIGGVAQGVLYGLLGFATILLYKSTGVANFAVGILATIPVFFAYKVSEAGASFAVGVMVALVVAIVLGAIVYLTVMLPNSGAGHLNLTIRTFGVYLFAAAALNASWAVGQPFKMASVFSTDAAFTLGGSTVSWNTVGAVGVAGALVLGFVALFRFTGTGLLLQALASRPDVAQLMGARTSRLTAYAWMLSTLVGACVGLLVAPVSLLSSGMLDHYLLYAISAAVIGGLTHPYGVFLVGAFIGVLNSLAAVYTNADVGILAVFIILCTVLVVRPWGLFGSAPVERL